MDLYPFTFLPIFKERPWGGRRLAELFGKTLPPSVPIGESWEICDRPEDQSLVANGRFRGRDLRWLMENRGCELLGRGVVKEERFPWLIKLLDAQDDLSIQVHPPASRAVALGGESKDELWYFASSTANAVIYAGLRGGVTRDEFSQRIANGSVPECCHMTSTHAGDVMAIPSGRVHALGKGNVVFEIQENSDTTYRVFDWNRVGKDGRPRELHTEASMASIDFNDFEPTLINSTPVRHAAGWSRELIRHRRFVVDELQIPQPLQIPDERRTGQMAVVGVVSGRLHVDGAGQQVILGPGSFVLLPAALGAVALSAQLPAVVLRITPPEACEPFTPLECDIVPPPQESPAPATPRAQADLSPHSP